MTELGFHACLPLRRPPSQNSATTDSSTLNFNTAAQSRTTLKGSRAKCGRERMVPINTTEQRDALQTAHRLAGTGSLIPANKTYIQQRHVYDGQCKAESPSNMHGLRHRYAQRRYEILTGGKSPAAGGPSKAQLDLSQRLADRHVRQQISHELRHERVKVTAVYLGSQGRTLRKHIGRHRVLTQTLFGTFRFQNIKFVSHYTIHWRMDTAKTVEMSFRPP